jgi:cbb3-type cytochrome oxidase maturation protein
MTALAWLIPAALFLGLLGVAAFMWALRSGQFEDLDGAAYRILEDENTDAPDDESKPHDTAASDAEDRRRDHAG